MKAHRKQLGPRGSDSKDNPFLEGFREKFESLLLKKINECVAMFANCKNYLKYGCVTPKPNVFLESLTEDFESLPAHKMSCKFVLLQTLKDIKYDNSND